MKPHEREIHLVTVREDGSRFVTRPAEPDEKKLDPRCHVTFRQKAGGNDQASNVCAYCSAQMCDICCTRTATVEIGGGYYRCDTTRCYDAASASASRAMAYQRSGPSFVLREDKVSFLAGHFIALRFTRDSVRRAFEDATARSVITSGEATQLASIYALRGESGLPMTVAAVGATNEEANEARDRVEKMTDDDVTRAFADALFSI